MNKNRWQLLIPLILLAVVLLGYWLLTRDKDNEPASVRVTKGLFEITVSATGEVEALESTNITIPKILESTNLRIRHIAITDMVKEGTVVKRGDFIATLDPAEVEDRIRQSHDKLERLKTNLDNAIIDSSLVLSDSRDQIRVAQDNVYDQEIKVEQSLYESKATQRQSQISLDKAIRNLEQKKRNYQQTKRRHILNISRANNLLQQEQNEFDDLQQLKSDLNIKAPSNGLLVYARYNNQKIKVGSYVSRWNPLIAILPDLSTLQSVVDVKEIDITKIKEGLPVRVKIDAFPNEEFSGEVVRIANIGQQSDDDFFNTFKVEIKVDPKDKLLMPGMTSNNRIIIESVDDAILVPRLAVVVNEENQHFVYKHEGLSVIKQEITIVGENDQYYRVTYGIKEKDRLMLNPPTR